MLLKTEPRKRLLLVEPDGLIRRLVVSVARDLNLAHIDEASSAAPAEAKLDATRFDGLVLSLDEAGEQLTLLRDVRLARYRTGAQVPVVVMASHCDEATVTSMRELGVRRLLLKPFKIKSILDSVAAICA